MSSGGKNKSLDELKANLLSVTNYSSPISPQDVSQPISSILPTDILNSEKERYLKEAEACENKLKNKEDTQKRRKPVPSQKRKKKKNNAEIEKQLPVISSPEDLIGKLVEHFTDRNIEDEEADWFKGVVVQLAGGPKANPKYFIRYFDLPDDLFCNNLFDDFKNGDVHLLPICSEDFIDASILHLYTDDENNEDTWWPAEVVDVDIDSSDMSNPDFFVLYGDVEESTDPEYYLLSFKII